MKKAIDIQTNEQDNGLFVSTAVVSEKKDNLNFTDKGEAEIKISTVSQAGKTAKESLSRLREELDRRGIKHSS